MDGRLLALGSLGLCGGLVLGSLGLCGGLVLGSLGLCGGCGGRVQATLGRLVGLVVELARWVDLVKHDVLDFACRARSACAYLDATQGLPELSLAQLV